MPLLNSDGEETTDLSENHSLCSIEKKQVTNEVIYYGSFCIDYVVETNSTTSKLNEQLTKRRGPKF